MEMEIKEFKCSSCGKYNKVEPIFLDLMESDSHYALCSLACLTAFAWELREREPKLSKSKQPIVSCGLECGCQEKIHTCKICGPECRC